MRLMLDLMRRRRPNVRVESAKGEPQSFFRLKELAATEKRTKNAIKGEKRPADVIGNAVSTSASLSAD
jgi:hypothetical protein